MEWKIPQIYLIRISKMILLCKVISLHEPLFTVAVYGV